MKKIISLKKSKMLFWVILSNKSLIDGVVSLTHRYNVYTVYENMLDRQRFGTRNTLWWFIDPKKEIMGIAIMTYSASL